MERKQNDLLQSQARTIHLKELENVSERTSTHGFTSCKSPGRKSYTFGDVFVSEVSFRQVTIFVSLKRAFYHPFHKMDKLLSPKLDRLFIEDFTNSPKKLADKLYFNPWVLILIESLQAICGVSKSKPPYDTF